MIFHLHREKSFGILSSDCIHDILKGLHNRNRVDEDICPMSFLDKYEAQAHTHSTQTIIKKNKTRTQVTLFAV